MSAHTPGPWAVVADKSSASKLIHQVGANGMGIIGAVWARPNTEVSDANARLIASSPDLLEAALDAEDFLFNLPGESEERSELIAKLRAAISKAGAKVADTSATGEGR